MLQRRFIQARPRLSRRAFWDTDPASFDFERHAKFIITRVFERGDKNDQMALMSYYGKEAIIQTLKASDSLLPIARERAKKYFHLSDQDFASYTSRQPARNLSRY